MGEIQGRRIPASPKHRIGEEIVRLAGQAPSVHNTQPWQFDVQETEATVAVALSAVPARQLPVLDPDGRQLTLSCGVALDHAVVAAEALGLDVRCDLMPASAYPLLARLTCRKGATPQPSGLYDAIGARRTYRDRFTAAPVPDAVLDELRTAAEASGCWAHLVPVEDHLRLEVLLSRADAQQRTDPSYLHELSTWSDAPPESGFGIPATSRDPLHGEGSSLALRDFGGSGEQLHDDPPPVDHPAVLVLGTDGDEQLDWLACGRALSRVLLTATAAGLAAQPLGQLTDQDAWRSALQAMLGLRGHPQVVLRLGYPAHEVPVTPRLRD